MEYEKHALSIAFPEMASSDFDELVRSMRDRGYDEAHPITRYDGKILDGWNRWIASQKARVVPTFRDFDGTDEEAKYFVYVENFARRHLTKPQKAAALHVMNTWLPPRQQLSDAAIADRSGLSSTKKVNQIGRVAEKNPELAHKVAAGEVAAGTAIRQILHEEPVGEEEENGGMNTSIVFILRNKKLIRLFHDARLKSGATNQNAFNKAIRLYVESMA